MLFAASVAGAGLRWIGRARAGARGSRRLRRLEARGLRVLGDWGWLPAILLFLMPLWSHWAMRPPTGVSAYSALFGYLPWSDAQAHFEGGNRLLAEGQFGPFSERRPLNASWLSVRLALTGGLPGALTLQAGLLGLSAYLASRSVAGRLGLWPSLATFALILGMSRDYIPTAATEPLGITFSCLALAVLFSRHGRRRLGLLALGLFSLDAALHARPGAQFLLPLFLAWALYVHRRSWGRTAAVLVVVVAAGGLSTAALNAFYGSGEGSFTSYPAYTLYGLTRNSNWRQASEDFHSEIEGLGREKDVAGFLYRKAFENLRRDPRDFLRALGRNEVKFLRKLPPNLSRIVSLRSLLVPSANRVRPSLAEVRRDLLWGAPLLLVGVAGFCVHVWRSGTAAEVLFWLAAGLGVLASVPFVYGDAGFRGLAAAFPFVALGLSVGLAGGRERPRIGGDAAGVEGRFLLASSVLSVFVVGATLVGPAMAHAAAGRPEARDLEGLTPGRAMVVSLGRCPAVVVTSFVRGAVKGVPQVERRDFHRLLELAALADQDRADLEALRPPFVLVSCYDYVTRRQHVVVAPLEILRRRIGFLRLEVKPVGNLFEVQAWETLGGPTDADTD